MNSSCINYIPALLLLLTTSAASQQIRRIPTSTTTNFHALTFSGDKGWIISYGTGQLFRSEDRGATWAEVWKGDSVYYEEMNFIDDQHGFISGGSDILCTSDAGENWKKIGVDTTTLGQLFIYGATFSSVSNGLISASTLGKSPRNINLTFKNGRWESAFDLPAVHFLKMFCNGGHVFASTEKAIYRMDGSYSNAQLLYELSNKSVGPIRDLYSQDSLIIAVTFRGYLITSHDNGITWKEQKLTDIPLRSIALVDELHGMAAGNRGIAFSTHNGGRAWQAVSLPDNCTMDIHRIVKYNGKLWLCGKGGSIFSVSY